MSVGHRPALTSLWVAAGPQSTMSCSSPIWRAKAVPKRVGVGVGVPAPRTWMVVGLVVMVLVLLYLSAGVICTDAVRQYGGTASYGVYHSSLFVDM